MTRQEADALADRAVEEAKATFDRAFAATMRRQQEDPVGFLVDCLVDVIESKPFTAEQRDRAVGLFVARYAARV